MHMGIWICVCVYVYTCVHACVCICVCVNIYCFGRKSWETLCISTYVRTYILWCALQYVITTGNPEKHTYVVVCTSIYYHYRKLRKTHVYIFCIDNCIKTYNTCNNTMITTGNSEEHGVSAYVKYLYVCSSTYIL